MAKSISETMDYRGLALKCSEIQDDNGNVVLGGPSGTARSTTQFDAVTGTTGATLTNVIGLVETVTPGTYRFKIHLGTVATTNSGIKVGLKQGTASMLTSIEYDSTGHAAAASVTSRGTTATDAATMFGSTTAVLRCVIEGTMVVALAGTLQVQAAQNAAHADTTSVFVGSFFEVNRIA